MHKGFAFLILVVVTFAAVAGEVPVTSPRYASAPGIQDTPVVASDGDGFLVVWSDSRPAMGVYGQLLAANGSRRANFNISLLRYATGATVLWTGTDYAVIAYNQFIGEFWAARISRDGEILTPPHTIITDGYGYAPFSAATNGKRIVIAYRQISTGLQKIALLELDTTVVSTGNPVPTRGFAAEPHIVTNGSDFVVAWSESFGNGEQPVVAAVRIDPNGNLSDPNPKTIATGGFTGAFGLASDGNSYLLAGWATTTLALHTVQLSRDLNVLSTHDVAATTPLAPALTWNGSQYIAVWTRTVNNESRVVSLPLDFSGAATGTETSIGQTGGRSPSIAASHSRTYVAWVVTSGVSDSDVWGALDTANMTLLSTSATQQHSPAIASSGPGSFVTAWIEQSGTAREAWMAHVSADGVVSGARKLGDNVVGTPRVVFDGTTYVVAWLTGTTLHYRRDSGELTPEFTLPFPVTEYYDVASDGHRLLFAWSRPEDLRVNAAREGDAVPVLLTADGALNPRAAFNGTNYLVTWEEQKPLCCIIIDPVIFTGDLKGTRLTPELTRLDTEPIVIADSEQHDGSPAIASDGRDWLVAHVSGGDVVGRYVSANGTPGEVVTFRMRQYPNSVSVAWSGVDFAVVWAERYAGGTTAFISRTRRGGNATPAAVLTAGPGPLSFDTVAIAGDGTGRVMPAYAHVVPDTTINGVARLFTRTLEAPKRMRAIAQ